MRCWTIHDNNACGATVPSPTPSSSESQVCSDPKREALASARALQTDAGGGGWFGASPPPGRPQGMQVVCRLCFQDRPFGLCDCNFPVRTQRAPRTSTAACTSLGGQKSTRNSAEKWLANAANAPRLGAVKNTTGRRIQNSRRVETDSENNVRLRVAKQRSWLWPRAGAYSQHGRTRLRKISEGGTRSDVSLGFTRKKIQQPQQHQQP